MFISIMTHKLSKYSNQFLLSLITFLLLAPACKRDISMVEENKQPAVVDAHKLVAPEGFNFSTEKTIQVRVGIAGNSFPGERFVIKIYNAEPNLGSLVSTGSADAVTGEYTTSIRVPVNTEYVWIEKINGAGGSEYKKVKITSAIVSHKFSGDESSNFIIRKQHSGLDCSSNCTNTYNNFSGNITINNGEVACFTGTIGGNITIQNGGAAKICASGTLTNITINGSGRVYLLETATIIVSTISCNSNASIFINWSKLTLSGSFATNGLVENHNEFNVAGDFNLNSGSNFTNYGELTVNNNFNGNAAIANYSKIIVNGTFNNNTNATTSNFCFWEVKGSVNNNGIIYNGRLMKCGQTFTQNSSGKTQFDNVGQLTTKNLQLNGDIQSIGTSRALIKVTASTTINSSGKLLGQLDICDSNGIETNTGQIVSPAAVSCEGYIPVCPCNTEGFGTPHIDDRDGDGIPDNQDEFPDDPLRAFNSYIPCFDVCYTLAFEDLWPATGDYDYNDMVVKFSVHKVLNYCNKVVDLEFKVQPVAIGASYNNGFGFRLDEVLPSAVGKVTGQSLTHNYVTLNSNGTEAGQNRAVIICFDSPEPFIHRTGGGMFNTQRTLAKGTSDIMRVVVTFSEPVEDAHLDISKLNPFIITNRRRDYEVHLPDFMPTSLANTSLFGTYQDRTNPAQNKYYRTTGNLPWALLIQDEFDYPLEKSSITSAYHYFDDWVLSGGTTNTTWYRDFPAFRNHELIY